MNLLNPDQHEPTKEDDKLRIANRIKENIQITYQELINTQNSGIEILWKNNRELTPQEICDALGTDAAQIFKLHGILTRAIVDIATESGISPDIRTPDNAFTVNVDGTVTVLTTPYIPKSD